MSKVVPVACVRTRASILPAPQPYTCPSPGSQHSRASARCVILLVSPEPLSRAFSSLCPCSPLIMGMMEAIASIHPLAVVPGVVCFLTLLVWVHHRVADVRIRCAGGTRAPVLAGNLISGKFFTPEGLYFQTTYSHLSV